jgi:DNA-3-methyladenine glycosylase I
MSWVREGADGVTRCWWCGDDPLYVDYHDREWGRRVVDDTRLFEKLCLEGFQSGLSWLTILRKRENFRAAFDDFDVEKIAAYSTADVNRLLADAGIVRHRGKIESTINNAQRAIELAEAEGSLHEYVAQYAVDVPHRVEGDLPIPSTSPESVAMSKDLKKRGWSFVGPTTMYAFMQAMGLVNDHLEPCFAHPQIESANGR